MSDSGYEPTQVNLPPVSPGGPATPPPTPPSGMPPVPPGGAPPVGPPPEEPRDLRPWIIGGILALIAVVVIVLLLLGGDDDDEVTGDTTTSSTTSSTSSTTSSTSSTTTSTTAPATTTTAPATTTTEAPPPTVNPDLCAADGGDPGDPETPAQTVYDAWTRGDELCAAELMLPAARTQLFNLDGQAATFSFQGCGPSDDPEIETDCAFFTEGTGMHFEMNFSDTEGWKVVNVFQTAD